jgi:hypothetical protein
MGQGQVKLLKSLNLFRFLRVAPEGLRDGRCAVSFRPRERSRALPGRGGFQPQMPPAPDRTPARSRSPPRARIGPRREPNRGTSRAKARLVRRRVHVRRRVQVAPRAERARHRGNESSHGGEFLSHVRARPGVARDTPFCDIQRTRAVARAGPHRPRPAHVGTRCATGRACGGRSARGSDFSSVASRETARGDATGAPPRARLT